MIIYVELLNSFIFTRFIKEAQNRSMDENDFNYLKQELIGQIEDLKKIKVK